HLTGRQETRAPHRWILLAPPEKVDELRDRLAGARGRTTRVHPRLAGPPHRPSAPPPPAPVAPARSAREGRRAPRSTGRSPGPHHPCPPPLRRSPQRSHSIGAACLTHLDPPVPTDEISEPRR